MTTREARRAGGGDAGGAARSAGLLLTATVAVAVAAGIGGLAARAGRSGYYESLDRPRWAPPSEVFSPVWTALYLTMAVAAWLVAREGLGPRDVRVALVLFAAQLALNAAWTPIFFAAERPGWALVDIMALLAVLGVTVAAFWRVRALAGALLVPYLSWVGFATALNLAIVAG